MTTFDVLGANLHNERAAVTWLRDRSRADSVEHYGIGLLTEAHKRSTALSRFTGHDYLTGPLNGGRPEPHVPERMWKNLTQDCGVLLPRSLPNLGHTYEFLSPAYPENETTGHQRWAQVVPTEIGGRRVTFIVLHPLPGRYALRGKNPDNPIVERYLMAVQWLDAEIDKQTTLGREVVVGADIQLQERYNRLWSPKHVFANHNMTWFWEGIDVIAWTPGLQLAARPKPRVLDTFKKQTGHPWLRVPLEVKPRRNR